MKYIITKTIDNKFTYYLGVDGWEGLIQNGFQITYKKAISKIYDLEKQHPGVHFDFIKYKENKITLLETENL